MTTKKCRKCSIELTIDNYDKKHGLVCKRCNNRLNAKYHRYTTGKILLSLNFPLFQKMINGDYTNSFPETQKWLKTLTPEKRSIFCRVLTNPEFDKATYKENFINP